MKGKGWVEIVGQTAYTCHLLMADAKKYVREYFHRGSHKNYNTEVSQELKQIKDDFYSKSITAAEARQKVQDLQGKLTRKLKALTLSCGGCSSGSKHKRLN